VHFCLQPYVLVTLPLPLHIIYFLHLLSTNHKCTQPYYFFCYSNPLLRRRRWTRILWWGVLGYVLPWLPFMWCYGVFCCSVSLRVILVFRDLIYVIIILYSWHLIIYEHFWPYEWNNWSWVMHTMSTWFWHKNRVWQATVMPSRILHGRPVPAEGVVVGVSHPKILNFGMWLKFTKF
jgi:hypothetical protein